MNYLLPTTILYPNAKGQVTLPKKLRDQLDIQPTTPLAPSLSGNQIILTPIVSVQAKPAPQSKAKQAQLYNSWKKLQGTWANDHTWEKTSQNRHALELKASSQKRQGW